MAKKLLKTTIAFIIIIASIIPCDYVQAATGKFASDETAIGCGNLYRGFDYYAYHFRDSCKRGTVYDMTDENPAQYETNLEGIFGIQTDCKGTTVTCTLYNHAYTNSGKLMLNQMDDSNKNILNIGEISFGNPVSFDMKKAASDLGVKNLSSSIGVTPKEVPSKYGMATEVVLTEREMELFQLKFIYSLNNQTRFLTTYLYYDGKKVQTCWITRSSYISDDIHTWNTLVSNINPNTCLNMYVGNKNYPITYPTSGTDGNCNHVKLWQAKSHEIVDDLAKKYNWNDEMKILALTKYLTENYAYDEWRVQVNHNQSRAAKYKRWNDDSLWMYYNNVGQCWDFANVMTIMCREQGIPCTSLENYGHTINIVWLNNEWIGIDISSLVYHENWEEKPVKEKWETRRAEWSTCYGYYDTTMNTHNQCIATPATTVEGGKGNPE